MAERRGFWPVVAVGVASAALAAVGSSRGWATSSGSAAGLKMHETVSGSSAVPLTAALSLLVLASWGALLVTRGRTRRWLALVGLVAATGALLSLALGAGDARQAAERLVLGSPGAGDLTTRLTAWYYLTGLALVSGIVTLALAAVRSPSWPAMGSRYDAPGTRTSGSQALRSEEADEDMWRALDQGHDPTR